MGCHSGWLCVNLNLPMLNCHVAVKCAETKNGSNKGTLLNIELINSKYIYIPPEHGVWLSARIVLQTWRIEQTREILSEIEGSSLVLGWSE